MTAMALERELATYERNRERLLSNAEGRFALIMGDEVKGTFSSYEDALQEGYKQGGLDKPFLVKAIARIESGAHFTRPLAVCPA